MPYIVTMRVNEKSHAELIQRVESWDLDAAEGEGLMSANVQVETVEVPPNLRVPGTPTGVTPPLEELEPEPEPEPERPPREP